MQPRRFVTEYANYLITEAYNAAVTPKARDDYINKIDHTVTAYQYGAITVKDTMKVLTELEL